MAVQMYTMTSSSQRKRICEARMMTRRLFEALHLSLVRFQRLCLWSIRCMKMVSGQSMQPQSPPLTRAVMVLSIATNITIQ